MSRSRSFVVVVSIGPVRYYVGAYYPRTSAHPFAPQYFIGDKARAGRLTYSVALAVARRAHGVVAIA